MPMSLKHHLHSGFQTISTEISQLSYCIIHLYTGHFIFIQLLTIIIFSNEHKLLKSIYHFLNLLNIPEDLDFQQHCCMNLKSHTVDSFQDYHIGCYCEGEEHFKPIFFTWHAPLLHDRVVIKNRTYFSSFVLWCKSTYSKACWTDELNVWQ